MAKGQRTVYIALRMFKQSNRMYQEGERVTTIDAKLLTFYLERGYIKKQVEPTEAAQSAADKNQLTIPDGNSEEPKQQRRKPAQRAGRAKPRKPAARKRKS
jgi:hypothetical protein